MHKNLLYYKKLAQAKYFMLTILFFELYLQVVNINEAAIKNCSVQSLALS